MKSECEKALEEAAEQVTSLTERAEQLQIAYDETAETLVATKVLKIATNQPLIGSSCIDTEFRA